MTAVCVGQISMMYVPDLKAVMITHCLLLFSLGSYYIVVAVGRSHCHPGGRIAEVCIARAAQESLCYFGRLHYWIIHTVSQLL